jgi:hypothetical protein
MASPRRSPVRMESFLINAIGVSWPQINNKNIRMQMNILAEMLQEELHKKSGKKQTRHNKSIDSAHTEGENVKFFIAYFRQRYMQETDVEYRSKISSQEIGMIKAVVKKMSDKDISIETFLSWVFDDFFDDEFNRGRYTPMVNFVCGTFIVTKFFMQNQPKIRKNKIEAEKKNKREIIRDHAKSLYRRTQDRAVQKRMEMEWDGTITLGDLETFLEDYEAKNDIEGEE